jgi:hypothetical protein
MVEFEIKVHPEQRLAYIPRQIVKALGTKLKMLPNLKAAVLYPEDATPQDVIRSLQIILQDLQMRAEKEQ